MKTIIKGKDGPEIVNLNRRRAIHERCLNCSSWHPQKVTNCSFKECFFFLFRTGKGKQNARARSKAIKEYCLWCMNYQVGEIRKCPSEDSCPLFTYRKGGLSQLIIPGSFEKSAHIEATFQKISS